MSLSRDREIWCVRVAEEIEETAVSGNSPKLFTLTRDAGEPLTSVTETVCHKNGGPNQSREQRQYR